MKAHFVGSVSELDQSIDKYRKIVSILKKNGVKLTADWLETAYARTQSKDSEPADILWSKIYIENREAVSRADFIIAEISHNSFIVGFQVAYALHMKKPILLLSSHDQIKGGVGVSKNEEIIKFSRYDDTNIEAILANFINENTINNKDLRFNFFIDRKILSYLNWASLESGQTKSEIIRSVLNKEIDRSNF